MSENTAAVRAFVALSKMHKEDEKMLEFIKHKKLFTEFMFWKQGSEVPAELVEFDNERALKNQLESNNDK